MSAPPNPFDPDALTEMEEAAVAPPRSALSHVYLVCGDDAGGMRLVRLEQGIDAVVGRGRGLAITVESARVSRRHARFFLRRGTPTVEDLGSRNGTRVNGDVVRGGERRLSGGDVIGIGPLELVVARSNQLLGVAQAAETRAKAAASDADKAPPDASVIIADPAMVALYDVARRLSASTGVVLVHGETGVGKEVVVEQIHRLGPRAAARFVRLGCASIPEALLESELFGHERGAFTGADRRRVGFFEAASGGTLLLDEIGEMPLPVQAKLLRVLERRAVVRVGGTDEIPVDVRIVCATHRDLAAAVASGAFRQDLFYRISTFTLEVPPLRDRPTELLLLADLFARRVARDLDLPAPTLQRQTIAALSRHPWPGNVRELRNAMEHAVVMAGGGAIGAEHLPPLVRGAGGETPVAAPIRDRLTEIERAAIEAALLAEEGNQTRAAKRLGISRRALVYKLTRFGLR